MSFNHQLDIRTVEMRFDNKKFEQGIKETMKSLEIFDKSLDAIGTGAGILSAVKVFDTLVNKAKVLGDVVSNVFGGIGNSIRGMVRNVTGMINQTSLGMQKYEALMTATRTMMNATGKSIEEISVVMENLNKYTDETSYEFGNLTTNMSTLISSGRIKNLEDAEVVMEGMANACAHAGISASQASGPIDALVRAMSRGKIMTMQWQQLSGYNFISPQLREQFILAAKELGILDKEGLFKTSSGKKVNVAGDAIENTLQYGWLTSDVVAAAMKVYADRESELGKAAFQSAREAKTLTDVIEYMKDIMSTGWMKSFEYLFGNVQQAAKFFTWMADSIGGVVDSVVSFRNELLKGWNEGGGRVKLIDSLVYLWETISEIGDGISTAFENVFQLPSVEGLLEFTKKVRQAMTDMYMWLGKDANEGTGGPIAPRFVLIRQGFEGLFSVLSFGKSIVKGFFDVLWKVVSTLFGSSDNFLLAVGSWGRSLKSFFETIEKSGKVEKFFNSIWETIKPLADTIRGFADAVFNFLGSFIGLNKEVEKTSLAEKIKAIFDPISEFVSKAIERINKFINFFTTAFNYLAGAVDSTDLKKRIDLIWEIIKGHLKVGFKNIVTFVWDNIEKAIFAVLGFFTETGGKIGESTSSIFTSIHEAIQNGLKKVRKTWEDIKKKAPAAFKGFYDKLVKKWPVIGTLVDSFKELGKSVYDFIVSFTGLDKFLNKSDSEKKTSVLNGIKDAISTIGNVLSKVISIASKVVNILSPIINAVRNLGLSLFNLVTTLFKVFGIFDDGNVNKTGSAILNIVKKIADFINAIAAVIQYLADAKNLEDLKKRASTVLASLVLIVIGVLDTIIKNVSGWFNKTLIPMLRNWGIEILKKVVKWLIESLPGFLNWAEGVANFFDNLAPNISAAIRNLIGQVSNSADAAVGQGKSWLFEKFEQVKAWLGEKIANLFSYMDSITDGQFSVWMNTIGGWIATIRDWVIRAFNWAVNFISGLRLGGDKGNNPFTDLISSIFTAGRGKLNQAKDWAVNMVAGAGEGLHQYGGRAVDAMGELVNNIIDKANQVAQINSPSKVMVEFGKYLALGAEYGIKKYANKPESAGAEMAGNLLSVFSGGKAVQQVSEFAKTAASSVANIGKTNKEDVNHGLDVLGFIRDVIIGIRDIVYAVIDVVKSLLSGIKWLLDHPFVVLLGVLLTIATIIIVSVSRIFTTLGRLSGVIARRSTVASNLMSMGIALGAIIFSLAALNAVATPEEILASVAIIIGLLTAVSFMAIGFDSFANRNKRLDVPNALDTMRSIALSLVGIVGSVLLMAPALLIFSAIPVDRYCDGLLKIGVMVFALGSALTLASNLSNGGGTDQWRGIVALAVSSVIMVGAFYLMYKAMEKVDFWTAVGSVAAIASLVIALGYAAGLARDVKMGVFLSLSLVVYTIILMFEALNNASKTFGGAVQTDILMSLLTLLIRTIGNAIAQAGSVKSDKIRALSLTFGALGLMIYAVGLSLETAKNVPWSVTVPMMAGISLIVYFLGSVAEAAKHTSFSKMSGVALAIAAIGVLAIASGFALSLAKDVKWSLAAVFMAGLAFILVALAAVVDMAKNLAFSQLAGLAILMGGVAVLALILGVALGLAKDVPWQTAVAFMGGLVALTIAIALVGTLAKNIDIAAVVKVAAAIIAFVAIIVVGIALIALIVSLIGNLIAMSLKAMFDDLSEALFSLGSGLADFQMMIKDVDGEKIGEVLLIVANIVGMIGTLIGVDYSGVDDFTTSVYDIGVALENFNTRVSKIDRTVIQEKLKVIDDIKAAAEQMNSVPGIGDMSTTIANIGGAIKLYYESLNGVDMVPKDSEGNPIDTSQIDSNGFVQMFKSIAGQMPDQEDLDKVGFFADNSEGTSLSNFAIGITNLGTALSSFSKDMGGVNQADVTTGITNLGEFAKINAALPLTEFDVFNGFFKGKKESLSGLGKDIEAVGEALGSFGDNMTKSIKVLDEETGKTNIDAGIEAANKLKDLGNALPTRQNAIFAWFAGKQMSLSEFGSNMSTLGHGVHNFVVNAFADGVTYDKTQIEAVADCVSTFVDIQNKIENKEHGNAISNFADFLAQAGTGINSFNKNLMTDENGKNVEYDVEKLKAISEVVDIFVEIQNKIENKESGNAINNFAHWLNVASGDFKAFFESASGWVIDADKLKAMGEMAGGIAEAFGRGFGDKSSEAIEDYSSTKITGSITKIVGDISAMFNPEKGGQFYSDMVDCGHYMVLGLEKGINDYAYRVTNAGRSLGSGATNAVRQVVMVNSPSKVMEDIGKWIDLGMEHGIIEYSGKPIEAAEFMAYGIEEAVRDATTVHSNPPLFNNIGGWIVKGLASGFDGEFPNLFDLVNGKMTQLKDVFTNGWDNILSVFNGKMSIGDAILKTLNLDEKKMKSVMDAFNSGDYATLISELTDEGLGESQIANLFGLNSENFIEGTSLEDMLKSVFGLGHDTTVIEADNVDVGKVDTLGDSTSNTNLGGKSTRGRGSSESSNLGKQTTTVSSGGLNLSMTDGYTIGDILNRIDRLETAITNMRIVMDSGVLAGQVASGVDKELGNYATLNGRWN